MKKIIRKLGTSIGIIFNKEDSEILNIHVGDIISIDDIKIIKAKEKKNDSRIKRKYRNS